MASYQITRRTENQRVTKLLWGETEHRTVSSWTEHRTKRQLPSKCRRRTLWDANKCFKANCGLTRWLNLWDPRHRQSSFLSTSTKNLQETLETGQETRKSPSLAGHRHETTHVSGHSLRGNKSRKPLQKPKLKMASVNVYYRWERQETLTIISGKGQLPWEKDKSRHRLSFRERQETPSHLINNQ